MGESVEAMSSSDSSRVTDSLIFKSKWRYACARMSLPSIELCAKPARYLLFPQRYALLESVLDVILDLLKFVSGYLHIVTS